MVAHFTQKQYRALGKPVLFAHILLCGLLFLLLGTNYVAANTPSIVLNNSQQAELFSSKFIVYQQESDKLTLSSETVFGLATFLGKQLRVYRKRSMAAKHYYK
jgi:hypothetical protein